MSLTHTREDGGPCDRHPIRAEDLVPPATLGMSCFAALHDLASALMAISGAIEELDAVITEPAGRAAVADAQAGSEKAMNVFNAMRRTLRDPAANRARIPVWELVDRAGHKLGRRATAGAGIPVGSVEVAVPVVAQVLTSLLTAAETPGAAAVVAVVLEPAQRVAIRIAAATAAPPPASIGATLAVAAHALASQGGALRCDEDAGRQVYTAVLPLAA